ncbi:MAG: hypothetical protein IH604_14430 [Burkholderiales bacterium]|nr:hypothetical protein [Burkholderiales bacterium]
MNPAEFWKNFRLGEELSISGAFIYNGLRRFHELRKLDYPDEIFEVFYYLSVGLERLLKIAVVLLEHKDDVDQGALEQSLITHSHLDLLHRIKQHTTVSLSTPHNELLSLLATFYKTFRYDRFSLSSVSDLRKERDALCGFFAKYLQVEIADSGSILGTPNEPRYRKFLRTTVQKISAVLYQIIETRARELNLYTYELRHGSKAQTIFLGEADIPAEDVLWKELLIFFMNTKGTSGYLQFLQGIPPLEFDPECVDEYLDCFQSDAAKAFVRDELEHHYLELGDQKGDRLKLMDVIGAPGVSFDDPDSEEEPTE